MPEEAQSATTKLGPVGGWTNLLSIPGNIRQQFLPFVLKPGYSEYTKVAGASKELANAAAQYFSFKSSKAEESYAAGYCKLNVCPSVFTSKLFSRFINKDISFQTLYKNSADDYSDDDLTAQYILNSMPSIQIREYLPDLKIDQFFNFTSALGNMFSLLTGGTLDSIADQFSKTMKDADGKGFWSNVGAFFKGGITGILASAQRAGVNLADLVNWFMAGKNYRFANKVEMPSFEQLIKEGKEYKAAYEEDRIYKPDGTMSILDFPFMMYYKLMSYYTTNVYELPCKIDTAFDNQGSSGWESGSRGLGDNKFINQILGKLGGFGEIINRMFSNIRINLMPSWNPTVGHAGMKYPTLNVNFSLFNDTLESAINNFLFINTIAPNNMWIQMGILQHSSSIYDIKIDGHSRMYACAGDVKVKFKGALRSPSEQFIRTLFGKYVNETFIKDAKSFQYEAEQNRLIKVPDVYEVELTFQSMLPANFNNYLYHYSHNVKMDTQFMTGNTWYPGLLGDVRVAMDKHLAEVQENKAEMDKLVLETPI